MSFGIQIIKIRFLSLWASLVFFLLTNHSQAQQVIWAKLYPLPEGDKITCIAQDTFGDMYVGGSTRRGRYFPGGISRAMIYKLNPEGDTIFSLWPGIYGEVQAILVDHNQVVRLAVFSESNLPYQTGLHLLSMTTDGLIFKRDTIPNILYVNNSCLGKDSSWILSGFSLNPINGLFFDTYVQRIRKDGTIEPFFTLNNNVSEQAHRVEQLPNGKYLVSGSGGGKVISYTFDENLTNPQPFETWYQATGANPMSTGHVSRINNQRYMVGGQSNPSIVGHQDSLKNFYWSRRDNGVQIPPQAMQDGSTVFGYKTGAPLFQTLYRLGPDSSTIWNMRLKDSLVTRGMNGFVEINCFTYFEDQSAVLAGKYYLSGLTDFDPIFLRISNVGTPVTSLSKPKRGTLSNETLAPWPNPTGGTLYLKQHFDKAEIRLYTLTGREVGQYQIRFGQPIEISHLKGGVYLYRAVIDGKSYSGKIIKN